MNVRFIPKRACEGAATIDHGDMAECPHEQCRKRVAHDLVDHPFFGFAATCPLKLKSLMKSKQHFDCDCMSCRPWTS
jgi:hypothetical protein